ncbi:MAG: MotA/TolQ/ExbB proton channel family protein [Pseudomonadota bacterium]
MSPLAIIGILAQASEIIETTDIGTGNHTLFSLVLGSGPVIKVTLVLLVFFSVVSWAIIGSKFRQLKKIKNLSSRFYQLFWQAKSIDAIVAKGTFRKSPAFNIFKAGVDTLRDNKSPGCATHIDREIRRAAEVEIEQMEYGVPFLATTVTAAPFIGLFGTVWGILNAFWKIGRTGASSLAIVGPNIAEALITTALGLMAAVPALIFYNFYVNRIRLISKDLNDFADDLGVRIRREYFNAS